MRALPKDMKKRHAQLLKELSALGREVENATQEYNDKLEECEDFCQEVADAVQEWMDDRSEKWQESDAASEVQDWKYQWEGADFTRLDDLDFDGESEFGDMPLSRE